MGGFFKGWRRSMGVATLLLACLLLSGWLRTATFDDTASIRIGNSHFVFTFASGLCRLTHYRNIPVASFEPPPQWKSSPTTMNGPMHEPIDWAAVKWKWHLSGWGFEFGLGAIDRIVSTMTFAIPLWTGFPLVGVAASLLILTPRPSTQKKLIEPVPEKTA